MNKRKKNSHKRNGQIISGLFILSILFCFVPNAAYADRSVDILRKATKSIETNAKPLSEEVQSFGEQVAGAFQVIVSASDQKNREEDEGTLTPAKRDNYNAQIIAGLGSLKDACDKHYKGILLRLRGFDGSISRAVVETREASGLKKDYAYVYAEKIENLGKRIKTVRKDSEGLREQLTQNNCDEKTGSEKCKKLYTRIMKKIRRIKTLLARKLNMDQQKKIAVAGEMITRKIAFNLTEKGPEVSETLRETLASFYENFYTIPDLIMLIREGENVGLGELGADADKLLIGLRSWGRVFEGIISDHIKQTNTVVSNAIGESGGGKTTIEKFEDIDEELKKIDARIK